MEGCALFSRCPGTVDNLFEFSSSIMVELLESKAVR